MSRVRHLGVLVVVLSTAACTCSSEGTGTGGGAGGGGGGGGGGAVHEECYLDEELPTPALMQAAYTSLVVNAQEGVSEAPLTAKGCMFLRRTVTGGQVRRLELLRYAGFEMPVLPLDGGLESSVAQPLARWDVALTGTTRGELDDDADGVMDTTVEEVVDSTGALQSYVRTHYDARAFVAPKLASRLTISRVSADRMALRFERATTSGVEVERAFEYERRQHACLDGTGPDTDILCGPGDKEAVLTSSMMALAQGIGCIKSRSSEMGAELMEALGKVIARGVEVDCYVGGQSEAAVDTGAYRADGTIQIYVNRGLFECDGVRQSRTMFHEFMHLVQGGHDPYDDIPKPGPNANRYADAVRSCESFCFDANPTKCTCAVCLNTKACDPRCTNLGSCVIRPTDGGVATMSEAIGAECRNPAYTGVMGTSAGSWHMTMMECNSMCAYGSLQCKSKSVSCDPTCN